MLIKDDSVTLNKMLDLITKTDWYKATIVKGLDYIILEADNDIVFHTILMKRHPVYFFDRTIVRKIPPDWINRQYYQADSDQDNELIKSAIRKVILKVQLDAGLATVKECKHP